MRDLFVILSCAFRNLELWVQVKLLKRAGKFSSIVPAQQLGEKLCCLLRISET